MDLTLWWIAIFLVLSIIQWRAKRAAGLPIAYALVLSMMHPMGAMPYLMEGYVPRSQYMIDAGVNLTTTLNGLYVALISFIAYVCGVIIGPMIFPVKTTVPSGRLNPNISSKLPMTLLLMSVAFFVIIGPIIRKIPSVGQLAGSGTMLSVLGVYLLAHEAARNRDYGRQWGWLAVTPIFPVVTMIFMGFAGFGGVAAATVWALSYRFIKPRIIAVGSLVAIIYVGMTFYINYMRERTDIRASVWGGSSMSSRFTRIKAIYENFEPLSLHNQQQMEFIDGRLNQNDLVGKAVKQLGTGKVDFARGGTLYIAAVALIPRILWPGKPNIGGSGGLVSRFTGMTFAAGTSVGVGQVLEFYINWGLVSSIIGFIGYGILVRYMDERAGDGLKSGDLWLCVRWLLPGLGLLQPGGSLSEVVGSFSAGIVFVWLLHKYVFGKYYNPIEMVRARGGSVSERPLRGSKFN